MASKVWSFLLPESGAHHLRVDCIGLPGQQVFVDGVLQNLGQANVFTGPENSLIELRGTGSKLQLYVNSHCVEEYVAGRRSTGDDTLRGLREKPSGSYLISPEIDASCLDLNIIRKWRFLACGKTHEVAAAHRNCVWEIILDGNIIDRQTHTLRENVGEVGFDIKVGDGVMVKASLHMKWNSRQMIWQYELTANSTAIPLCWTKLGGEIPVTVPVIIPGEAPIPAELQSSEVEEEAEPARQQSPPRDLPQGVSFDRASGAYQASIRAKSGRFVFLGEFRTPEEAHSKYLEAVPIHCPGKTLAPEVPT